MGNREKIGIRLQEIRNKKGLTLKQVASKLNVIPQTINRWEMGKNGIPSTKLDKLCEVLKIKPSYLFSEIPTTIEYPINSLTNKKKISAENLLPIGINYVFLEIKDKDVKCLQIEKGDSVIIDTDNTKINEKFIYALSLNGKIICRKAKGFKNNIIIISDLLKECEICIFHKSEVKIIGKVVRIIRKL